MYQPNKSQLVALAAALGSFATRESEDIELQTGTTMILTVKLANKLGTVTFTPYLERKLKNGDYGTFWTAAAALGANGTVHYAFGKDSIEALAYFTEVLTVPIPKTIRVGLTYTGAGDGNEFDTYAEIEIHP